MANFSGMIFLIYGVLGVSSWVCIIMSRVYVTCTCIICVCGVGRGFGVVRSSPNICVLINCCQLLESFSDLPLCRADLLLYSRCPFTLIINVLIIPVQPGIGLPSLISLLIARREQTTLCIKYTH